MIFTIDVISASVFSAGAEGQVKEQGRANGMLTLARAFPWQWANG